MAMHQSVGMAQFVDCFLDEALLQPRGRYAIVCSSSAVTSQRRRSPFSQR